MKSENLKASIQAYVEQMASKLAGNSLNEFLIHIKSYNRLRKYSGINRLLILAQNSSTQHVLCQSDWTKLGISIKEGANPIYIYAPIFGKEESEEGEASAKKRPVCFAAKKVWAIEDTTAKSINWTPATPERALTEEGFMALLGECPHNIVWDNCGSIKLTGDSILIPRTEASTVQEALQILQAWSYKEIKDDNPKSLQEDIVFQTEAYLSAFAIAEALGIKNIDFSAEKIIALWGGKPKKLKNGLDRIDVATRKILQILIPVSEEIVS